MMKKKHIALLAIAIIQLFPLASFGASNLTILPSDNGVFVVQGAGMSGVAALDINISYDPQSLAAPRVEQGSLIAGAMMAANPNVPGIVRIAIIRATPIHGTGAIIKLTFDRRGEAAGKITGFQVRLADINGKPLPSSAQIVNPAESVSADSGSPSRQNTTASQSAPPTTPGGGSSHIVIAGTDSQSVDTPPSVEATRAAAPPDASAPEQETGTAKEIETAMRSGSEPENARLKKANIYTQESVLDLFREYRGVRSAESLLMLFDQEPMIGFRQEPRIFLSDGKSSVIITFIFMDSHEGGPRISLVNARVLSQRRDADNTNTWHVTAAPEKDAHTASLAIPQSDIVMVFPLTLAPEVDVDVDRSGKVTDADFAVYLRGPKSKNLKGFDLNSDGIVNYIDDYIFTANYMVKTSGGAVPNTPKK